MLKYLRPTIAEAIESLTSDPGHAPAVGLRAFAMLWVIWFHGVTTTAFDTLHYTPQTNNTLGYRVVYAWWPLGFAVAGDAGVDLFFVLSGFLLGHMLLRELENSGRINITGFFVRR